MPTISDLLSVGRLSLSAQQQALHVTGNNIANANTEGYTRQRVNIESATPYESPIGFIGTGARASDIQRIRDQFIGSQINEANQEFGRWEAQHESLERIEILFNEADGVGLNSVMSDFWNAWQDLANNPSGTSERVIVTSQGEVLANTLQTKRMELETAQDNMNDSIVSTVAMVNSLAAQLDDLNGQITVMEQAGHEANDLRDTREQTLKELSELIDFTAIEEPGGQVRVTLGDGNILVGTPGNPAFGQLATTTNATTGFDDVVWDTAPAVSINSSISAGKLKGWLETRDTVAAGYITQLDDLAASLITEVNTLHAAGYDLNGSTGTAFFTGSDASDIALGAAVAADPSAVAAASSLAGVPGGNANALAIADISSKLTMNGGNATYDDFYNAMIGNIGIKTAEAEFNYDYTQEALQQYENYRDSISGVSLDEEMVNMVKFQQTYQASAKIITTVDEMLTTLMNM
jgi:flagellar hook-associated protein 1 FlgK